MRMLLCVLGLNNGRFSKFTLAGGVCLSARPTHHRDVTCAFESHHTQAPLCQTHTHTYWGKTADDCLWIITELLYPPRFTSLSPLFSPLLTVLCLPSILPPSHSSSVCFYMCPDGTRVIKDPIWLTTWLVRPQSSPFFFFSPKQNVKQMLFLWIGACKSRRLKGTRTVVWNAAFKVWRGNVTCVRERGLKHACTCCDCQVHHSSCQMRAGGAREKKTCNQRLMRCFQHDGILPIM